MPNGPRILIDSACYHIIARGNQKQRIFKDDIDFSQYLKRVKKYKKKYSLKLYCFCLMPNHVHMVCEIKNKENLSKFMQGLTRSYTGYFNKKYGKVGQLWQGRFKSKVIIRDKYLIDCINYIELNPVRAEIVKAPHEYQWSSYRERNLGIEKELHIVNELSIAGVRFPEQI